AGTIDVERGMRDIQKAIATANANLPPGAQPDTLHQADGIHLNSLGHAAMAYVILKGLGAPAEVSTVVLDAASTTVRYARGTTVTNLHSEGSGLEFTSQTIGLPITFGVASYFITRWAPYNTQFDRDLLTVLNLPDGVYDLEVD